MKAAVIRSLAPRAIRGKISVVNAAALAPFNRSRRVVDVGVVLLMDNLLELPF
jgi:predicted deacylase